MNSLLLNNSAPRALNKLFLRSRLAFAIPLAFVLLAVTGGNAFGDSSLVDVTMYPVDTASGTSYTVFFAGKSYRFYAPTDGSSSPAQLQFQIFMDVGVPYQVSCVDDAGNPTPVFLELNSNPINECYQIVPNSVELGQGYFGTPLFTQIPFSSSGGAVAFDAPTANGDTRVVADGATIVNAIKPAGVSDVTWSIEGDSLGCALSSTGAITVGKESGTLHIVATSSGCPSRSIGSLTLSTTCGCSSGSCPYNAALHSVDYSIDLGWSAVGSWAGCLSIKSDLPSSTLATPGGLHYKFSRRDVEDITNDSGTLLQVKGPQFLANIVTNNPQNYVVQIYSISNVLAKVGYDLGDVYGLSGSPFRTFTISNPSGDTNVLEIVAVVEGGTKTFQYTWNGSGWELDSGDGLKRQTLYSVYSEDQTVRYVTNLVQQGTNVPVYQSTQSYLQIAGGERLLNGTIGTGTNAMTNQYAYTDQGWLQQVNRANGSWEYYNYDDSGRATNMFSSFGNQGLTTNSSLCRYKDMYYGADAVSGSGDDGSVDSRTPRRTINYLLGQEVGRSYFAAVPGQKLEITCVTPGAQWNDPSNLVTKRTYITDLGPSFNQLQSVLYPDGTADFYQYGDPTFNPFTNIFLQGHPDSSGANIDSGSETVSVYGDSGQLLSQTVINIDTNPASSNITISQETYEYDDSTRLTNTTYLDGTSMQSVYDCCELTSQVDRAGTITSYSYDDLKRLMTTTRAGITVSNVYDANGDILSTVRYGTDGSAVTNLTSLFDDSGTQQLSIDALGNTTTDTHYIDGSGQTIEQTTFPDLSTRVETYAMDGSLTSLTGTATHGVRYEYGVTNDAGVEHEYTKTIPLNNDGTDTGEWVKTYTDMAGRVYKTLYADGSSEMTFFDQQGQQAKTVDPDGVTMLFRYNRKGEQEYTAIDMDQNGVIDLTGTDLITRTISDVVAAHGTFVSRTRAFEWARNGEDSPTLTSISEQEVDGLRSWSASYGLTNFTQTSYLGSGIVTVTQMLPDGSQVITTNQFGRPISSTSLDSLGSQIGQTTYGYDAYGRQATVADMRTGTNSYGYTAADRLATVATPVPAAGQIAQITTKIYDNMGRNYQVNLPDGTSVTNVFYTTGELKQTCGSRTYPVQYVYDYLGRVKTMTTWQNFAMTNGAAVTTWNYDLSRGFQVSKQYNDGNGPVYTNTPAGRLHSRTWARGITTTYGYDEAGRMTNISYSDSTPGIGFVYDRRSRPVQVTDSGICNRTFNDAGQVLTDDYANSTLNLGSQLGYTYDSLLRPAGLTNTSLGSVTAYGYDYASRLASVSDGMNTATYTYVSNSSLVSQVQFAQGVTSRLTTTRSYDNLDRLTNVLNSAAANLSSMYGYNQANQRTNQLREDGSYWVYGYDSLGQVTSGVKYWSDGTPVAGQQFGYSFDTIGNRMQTQTGGDSSGGSLRTATYGANLLNQYTNRTVPGYVEAQGAADSSATVTVNGSSTYRNGEYYRAEMAVDNNSGVGTLILTNQAELGTNTVLWNRHALVAATPEGYGYDADGNLTNDGKWSYTWNGENQLTVVQSVSTIPTADKERFEYSYDYQGRRIYQKKLVWNPLASAYRMVTEERYWYDGWNLIGRSDLATGNVQAFVWGLDLSGSTRAAGGVGGLLILDDSANGSHFYSYDGNGNVLGLINANDGTLSAQYEYGPFGELLKATGPLAFTNPICFSTKFEDEETGLSYYGYRYYNSNTGKWLSKDPMGVSGGLDSYDMIGNNPVGGIDMLGLILFAFDGTGNDSGQDKWETPNSKHNAPTNIRIMFELYNSPNKNYMWGVGTRTDIKTGNLFGNGTADRLDEMLADLKTFHATNCEPVDIIGFSRGAASGRIFANEIESQIPDAKIRFLGLFDTVAQIGLPNRFNFQYGYNLNVDTSKVGYTAHAVAENEYRSLFPLTSISKSYEQGAVSRFLFGDTSYNEDQFKTINGPNYWEQPFEGAHSDLGGGYQDTRNLDALRWMIQRGQAAGAPFGDLRNYQEYDKLKPLTTPHDSRYPFLDTIPGTSLGSTRRVIFQGNN